MNNKLVPVIIAKSGQKGWGYRSRDGLIALAAFTLWTLVMARLYMFFIVDDAALEHLYGSIMIKVVLVGFAVTFLLFHCWALYNRHLYTRYLKRQQRTPYVIDDADNKLESETTIQAQDISQIPTQAVH